MPRASGAVIAVAIALASASNVGRAQDARASPPLPSFPQIYETADQRIRIVQLADGLSNPWSLAWLPNGDLLITERAGRLRLFHDGKLDPSPIAGVPEVKITTLGGLLEVLPHPQFGQKAWAGLASGGWGRATPISRRSTCGDRVLPGT